MATPSTVELHPVEEVIDLDLTEALLKVLQARDVHSFQGYGITVVFNEKPETYAASGKTTAAAEVVDDGHSTSTKRVDGFRNPILWQTQNGKLLRFDGSLE